VSDFLLRLAIIVAVIWLGRYARQKRRDKQERELAALKLRAEAFEQQRQDYERRRAEEERMARIYANAQTEQLRRQQEQQRQYDEAVRAFISAQQQNYYRQYTAPQSHANAQQAEQAARAKAEIKRQAPARAWQRILGPCETREAAEAAYRAEAKKRHPDLGGSAESMAELNAAIKEARLMLPGVH